MNKFTVCLAVLASISGCSLVNALQGEDDRDGPDPVCPDPNRPECQEAQFQCNSPLGVPSLEDTVRIDGCMQDASEPPSGCRATFGVDAVFELQVPPGVYTICVNGPLDSQFTMTDDCNSPGGNFRCLTTNDCAQVQIEGRTFVTWHASELGACGPIDVTLFPGDAPGEFGPQCLDGEDNDSNGLSDCEEDSCKFDAGVCQFESGLEQCDGTDDQDTPGLPPGLIDEVGCRCVNDDGCDHIDVDSALPYLCHVDFSPNGDIGGTCAPRCDNADNVWCEALGGLCMADGRCRMP